MNIVNEKEARFTLDRQSNSISNGVNPVLPLETWRDVHTYVLSEKNDRFYTESTNIICL